MEKRNLAIGFCFALVIQFSMLFGQVAINTDKTQPDASAILDVKSTNKGMLVPRMSIAQRDNIANPANGLMIYNTDIVRFQFFSGTQWVTIGNDNLGNHTMTQHLRTNGRWISNDGNGEGIWVSPNGDVGIGTNATGSSKLTVGGSQVVNANLNVNQRLTTKNFRMGATDNPQGKVLTAFDANGEAVWSDNRFRVTYFRNTSEITISDINAWTRSNSLQGGELNIDDGDAILVRASFAGKFTSGSGDDPIKFRLYIKNSGNITIGGETALLENFENNRGEFAQVSFEHLFTGVSGGSYSFGIDVETSGFDDTFVIDNFTISAIKF